MIVFHSDEDREMFLDLVGKEILLQKWKCFEYALMDNHYHFLLESCGNLATGMKNICGIFTQRINRKYDRSGHVFQGRYGSVLVNSNPHLFELARYIVLNPTKAGLVKRPEDYKWSSYRAMIGLEKPPEWLDVSWIVNCVGDGSKDPRSVYKKYVEESIFLA